VEVREVLDYIPCPCQTVFISKFLGGRKRSPDDLLQCPHHFLQGLDAVSQDALLWYCRKG